jgi:tRNA threonylcarbamoyladenosine biosynthesis protein TsaE
VIEAVCHTVEQTHAFAAHWAQAAARALTDGVLDSVVFGLDGELGAGKTEWVRGFMQALNPERGRDVRSPSYAIVHIYEGSPPVRHLDLYRLQSVQELEAIGYRDHYYDPGISLVEWMGKIPEAMPRAYLAVHIEMLEHPGRKISIKPHSESLTAWAQAVWT